MLYAGELVIEPVQEPHPLLRQRQRDPLRPRSARPARRAAAAAGLLLDPRRASAATVGCLEQRPHRHRGVQRRAEPRRPPGWRSASCRRARRSRRRRRPARPRAPPRTRPATISSIGVDGARNAPRLESGAGSALRSSLPLTRQRERVEHHERRRHHVRRQRTPPARCAASAGRAPTPGRRPRSRAAAARCAGPRAPSRRACATPSQPSSAASISPSSIRSPRSFTWKSARPTKSSSPSARPAHQVAGAVHPRRRAAERVGHEPVRGQLGAARGSRGPARPRTGRAHRPRRSAPAAAARRARTAPTSADRRDRW